MTREMLLEKSLEDLRAIAKTLGVKSLTKYRKAELADIIMNQGRLPGFSPAAPAAPAAPTGAAEAPAPRRRGRPRKNPLPAEPQERPAEPTAAPAEPQERPAEPTAAPAEPQERPAPQRPEVDYTPRRRGRPRKAINDPTPIKPDPAEEPAAEQTAQEEGAERGSRQRQRFDQPRQDHRQRQRSDRQQTNRRQWDRGYERNDQHARWGYPEDDSRREGYYNAEYGTSNPAVPELLEGGECGDTEGILEVVSDGYGFLRCDNYLPGPRDVYVSNAQIRRFRLKTGDKVAGKTRPSRENDKYMALLYITSVNDRAPEEILQRPQFDELTPIFPNERFTLDSPAAKRGERLAIRLVDLMAPIGRGQRGLIVSQPKAGKTTLLKNIANGISENYPDVTLIVLLIDERPEEVTDMQRSIRGEVVYSTFDELPERHTRVAEMVLERSMRLVEQGRDVVVLMDSITRLARAYNLTINPTGRTLSGGMDPGALYKPKRFFGAARNIEGGGSLTVIATALVETGSRMDDMVYEEFKGTGNMEIHLDRKLSERRIFPAIDIYRSGTRRDELLLSAEEAECASAIRRMLSSGNPAEVTEQVIDLLNRSETTEELTCEVNRVLNAYGGQGYSAAKSFMRHY